jgi:hypothetical protein
MAFIQFDPGSSAVSVASDNRVSGYSAGESLAVVH